MKSKAKTVKEYLNELFIDRLETISTLREVILKNLPIGYEETMNWGMITYEIPLSTYPDTYNGKPLMYAALASQKNNISLYLNGVYTRKSQEDRLKDAFAEMGVKPNMGKSCIRFTKLEKIPMDTIGELIGEISPKDYIKHYEEKK